MDSMLIGSFPKPSYFISFPVSKGCQTDLRNPRCQTWSTREKYTVMKLQRHIIMHHGGSFDGKSLLYRRCNTKYLVNAASESPLESETAAYRPKSLWESLQDALNAFYRFSRPHTVIGTALSIISVSLLAAEKLSDFTPLFFTGVLEAIVAALLMNIYIVGLNQLSDIEIDKVNKPYLPLASGEYSVTTGVTIVSSFAIMSFLVGWTVGSWPLFWALFISFVLGTAYSINADNDYGGEEVVDKKTLGARFAIISDRENNSDCWLGFLIPLLRWKRYAFVAAMCILAVRAVIVQIAFYLHVQTYVYGRQAIFTKPVIFATGFMSFFSVVIALFKDIPDIVGDQIYGIRSFTVRLGQKRVFWICISLLQMAYAAAILVGASSSCLWSKLITVLGHAMLASILWSCAKSVDLESKAAITTFYMFIWKLFYAEYLLIPLVR